jgi:hypothetical protein
MENFRLSLDEIAKWSESSETSTVAINQFADWSPSEWQLKFSNKQMTNLESIPSALVENES